MADGTKNIIPVRTEAEAKAKGRRGGIASGKARRAKKTMREWAEIIGSIEVPVTQPDGTALDGGDLDAGIVDDITAALGEEYPPLGVALIMQGEHLCKTMRGARKPGKMSTCRLEGIFKDNPAARNEFLSTAAELLK